MVSYDSHDDKDIWYANNNKKSLKIPKGSNQNPYIVEEQITQWQNQKLQTTIYT